jgi:hypothetical protein
MLGSEMCGGQTSLGRLTPEHRSQNAPTHGWHCPTLRALELGPSSRFFSGVWDLPPAHPSSAFIFPKYFSAMPRACVSIPVLGRRALCAQHGAVTWALAFITRLHVPVALKCGTELCAKLAPYVPSQATIGLV